MTRPSIVVAFWIGAAITPGVVARQAAGVVTPAQPPAVTLTLRIAGGQRPFHPGEIIPIELEFTSATKGRYVVDGSTHNRSPGPTIDQFRVEPNDGTTDPFLDYLGAFPGTGGGLGSSSVLGDRPYVVALDLNNWFRFDEPGRYTLSVRSDRVIDEPAGSPGRPVVVPVESNTVSIDILPRDVAWESAQIAAFVARLDPAGSRDPGVACRGLEFLATNRAVDEMIRRLSHANCGWNFMFGLFAAPDRRYVVEQMTARLDAPDQIVNENYLRTLAALSVYVAHPEFQVEQSAATKGRPFGAGGLAGRPELVQAALERFRAMEAAGRSGKDPAARAAALLGALIATPRGEGRDALREQLAPLFLELPAQRQSNLLESNWPLLDSPLMLPALRTLSTSDAARRSYSRAALGDLALRRWWGLAPDEARAEILKQIPNPPAGATIATLGLLPDPALPDFDAALAANVAGGRGFDAFAVRAALLERYGTPAVSAQVLAATRDRLTRMACAIEAPLLGYFARVDPPAGRALLEQALASRATGCYGSVLSDIAKMRMTAVVEDAAMAHLSDPDPDVARSAAEALGAAGSAAAKAPLERAFAQWHEQWAGRADAFRFTQAVPNPNLMQGVTEQTYLQALVKGAGWHATAADVRRYREWCVTDQCRQSAEYAASQADSTVIRAVSADDQVWASVSLAQYQFSSLAALDRRLATYPRGTTFTLDVQRVDSRKAAALADQIRKLAEARGLIVR